MVQKVQKNKLSPMAFLRLGVNLTVLTGIGLLGIQAELNGVAVNHPFTALVAIGAFWLFAYGLHGLCRPLQKSSNLDSLWEATFQVMVTLVSLAIATALMATWQIFPIDPNNPPSELWWGILTYGAIALGIYQLECMVRQQKKVNTVKSDTTANSDNSDGIDNEIRQIKTRLDNQNRYGK